MNLANIFNKLSEFVSKPSNEIDDYDLILGDIFRSAECGGVYIFKKPGCITKEIEDKLKADGFEVYFEWPCEINGHLPCIKITWENVIEGETTMNKNDPVNHPSHYTRGKIEVADFIEDQGLNNNAWLAMAIKYICRAGYKDPEKYTEDLEKAVWYLNREIWRKNHDCTRS